jgi:hypothetical protein
MIWPEHKPRIPEGHYQFRLNREPDLRAFTYTNKKGEQQEGRKIILYAVGIGDEGEFPVSDGFLPWEDRYKDLLAALHVEHGRDIQMTGSVFEADIEYQPSKKDPGKSYPHIVKIVVPQNKTDEGDDIPF